MPTGPDRTGVMVVRIWIDGTAGEIRARLTETPDISTPEQITRAAANADEVIAIVREWIEVFLAAAATDDRE